MKGCIFYILLFLLPLRAWSQHAVRFVVHDHAPIKRDSIFIAGAFNDWPALPDLNNLLSPGKKNEHSIELNLAAGIYEYKYTGGTWNSVEKGWNNQEVLNRTIQVNADTIIHDTIYHWRDKILASLMAYMSRAMNDTVRVSMALNLAHLYTHNSDHFNEDSSAHYLHQTHLLLQKIKNSGAGQSWSGYDQWLLYAHGLSASLAEARGNFSHALEIRLESLKVAERRQNPYEILSVMDALVDDYFAMKDYQNAMIYSRKLMASIPEEDKIPGAYTYFIGRIYYDLAKAHYHLGNPDSSRYYLTKALKIEITADHELMLAQGSLLMGDIYFYKNELDSAVHYYKASIAYTVHGNMFHIAAMSMKGIALVFQKRGDIDSALYYARTAIDQLAANRSFVMVWSAHADSYIADISPLVAELYRSNHQLDSAYKYLHLSVMLKDSLYNVEKIRHFQNLTFNESVRKEKIEQEIKGAREVINTRVKLYSLIFGMIIFLIIAFILYRNNQQKQIANAILSRQKGELQNAITHLQVTQKQLIQSEKMASLGELTAGIAHEIQNPLNFVNNFSEVNAELIDELNAELAIGNWQQAKEIGGNIRENEEKIIFHGKRADAIVKGMLQHSRASSGVKEPTDINALVDEYLRLAYHGLRAKDKSFNATMKTDYDPGIGLINIIPQDIGRVILNLITNAFYAITEKKKHQPDYEPTVEVITRKLNDKVEIRIIDNGGGIPQNMLDKIFQPFFTTKPTGQGTGLGLSLSYDIIKAHGGDLKLETKEGEGSAFIVLLRM